MSAQYTLSGFIERFDEWVERESPSSDWQIEVGNWILGLPRNVFDRAVFFHWDGMHGWRSRICLDGDQDRVVMCAYYVYNDKKSALCWRLKFAPYYDDDVQTPVFGSEDF